MANLNPLELSIVDIFIQKFDGTDKQSIKSQFVELLVFQSMFEPTIKAELLVNDGIGLFFNFPLTGEELVVIQYQQTATLTFGQPNSTTNVKQLQFIIKGVRNVAVGDRARSLMYTLDLASVEFLQNTRKYVAKHYSDNIENMAKQLYQTYIQEDTQKLYGKDYINKEFNVEESIKVRSMIVPNLRPFQGIQWLAKHAVASESDKHFLYLFFENNNGFNFVTIQKLIEEALTKREALKKSSYRYISDNVSDGIDPNQDLRLISNIVNNKRLSSIEKIAGGYYQNELFEISMLQKAYNSTPTELKSDQTTQDIALEPHPLNTAKYIDYVKNEVVGTEYSNRIRYIINNYEDFDTENRSQPEYRLKFGNATKYLYALNQIDLTITIPANIELNAGDIIYCDLPETQGFNNVQTDKYLSGLFIVSEVKHVIANGGRAATSLRIYKDGYMTSLFTSSLYTVAAAQKSGITLDPSTGKIVGGT